MRPDPEGDGQHRPSDGIEAEAWWRDERPDHRGGTIHFYLDFETDFPNNVFPTARQLNLE